MLFGSTFARFMAMSDEAPQSMRTRLAAVSSNMHVLNLPPLPKASPLPRKTSRMVTVRWHGPIRHCNDLIRGIPRIRTSWPPANERPRNVVAWRARRHLLARIRQSAEGHQTRVVANWGIALRRRSHAFGLAANGSVGR